MTLTFIFNYKVIIDAVFKVKFFYLIALFSERKNVTRTSIHPETLVQE